MAAKKMRAKGGKPRALLLEGIHPDAAHRFCDAGFEVEEVKGALDERDLLGRIGGVSILGIRSKTHLGAKLFARGKKLISVGAFCIGTNQIDLDAAMRAGVPVFNAPFSNTRSVAELVICDIIMLFRRLIGKIERAHAGGWDKSSAGCVEVRGKTLGIVGYGHIGSQVSILAEALGMRVIYHDIVEKLSIGNAQRVPTLKRLMEEADCVTLHVPDTPATRGMIGARELSYLRPGALLINTSRGTVVDVDALAAELKSGRLGGVAADVFPREPKASGDEFATPLQRLPNVILTPHIGGATVEAQHNIGLEVATKLIRFHSTGSTEGAVNFPSVVLPEMRGVHRILHIHRNVPGVMQKVNTLVGRAGINIEAQVLHTHGEIGYLIMDTGARVTGEMLRRIGALPETIRARVLF